MPDYFLATKDELFSIARERSTEKKLDLILVVLQRKYVPLSPGQVLINSFKGGIGSLLDAIDKDDRHTKKKV